ncbi:MAG: TraR/DksA family transcriptional regulator [bacterium]|nr:TraR/DksA family transcriptional regulator [bacterium]
MFRAMLLAKRSELVGDVDNLTNEALRRSRSEAAGDLSSMPIHMADIGSDNWEQEFTLGLIDNERTLLAQIDEALERILARTYGICLATRKPISITRLRAKPWAKYCIEYARLRDEGRVPR